MPDSTAFPRLLSLLKAGYRYWQAEGVECVFLEYPRRIPHWRLMLYDNGTLVGDAELRIRPEDHGCFSAFLATIPKR